MLKPMRRTATMSLVLVLALSGAACGNRARALCDRAAKTYAALTDYQVVTEIISGGGGPNDRVVIQQSMRKPDSYRLDSLEPVDIKGQTMIRNGRALWSYDPVARELIISGIDAANYDSNDRIILADVIARFATVKDAKYLRSEQGDTGTLAVVEYPDPAPDQDGNLVRLWADAKTGIPERVEYIYRDGSVTQTVVFRDLRQNPGLPDDRFNFAVPPGTTIINDDSAAHSVTLEEARRTADFQIMLPDRLPEGYDLTDISLSGGGDNLLVTLSYTSGERLIELSEGKYSGIDGAAPGSVKQVVNGVEYSVDAAEGFATIGWTRDGVSITLTADRPLEELFSIAESLK
jgi:outer membrane lipoprotein-sorting protein